MRRTLCSIHTRKIKLEGIRDNMALHSGKHFPEINNKRCAVSFGIMEIAMVSLVAKA